MAWSFTGFRGSNNNKAAGTVLVMSPNQIIPAGAVVVAVAISDNTATGGGQTNNHLVADFKGNVWTKIREQSNAAVAAVGVTASVWVSRLDVQLLTTDSIVLGLSATAAAKAIGLYEYAIGAGNLLQVSGKQSSEQDATAAPAVTLSNLDNAQYALFGVVAREEDNAGTYTMDADYTDRTKFGTTGGVASTNVSAIVGDRIGTLTGDTFAPTGLSAAADVVTMLVALKEVVPYRQTVTKVTTQGGKVYVEFGKTQREFGSLAEAKEYADFPVAEGREILHRLAISRYLAIDPTASNPSVIEGHSIAFTNDLHRMVEVF